MNHDVPPTPASVPPASDTPASDTRLADKHLEITFRILAFGGLGFIVLGSALQFFAHGALQPELVAPQLLPLSLLKLQPQALTTFGILMLVLGPATGLLVLTATYLRQRERLIPLVALIVFTIILLSVPIEHWTRSV